MAILLSANLPKLTPSADPNTLDYYEEGKWVPVLTSATTPPSDVTYALQVGQYTRIGRLIFAAFKISITSLGSGGAGQVRVTGFPSGSPVANLSQLYFASTYWENITLTGFIDLGCSIVTLADGDQAIFQRSPASGGGASPLDWTNLSATTRLGANICYATELSS